MLPRDHQHLVINVSIVVDEKVNKLGHEDLILVEGSRKERVIPVEFLPSAAAAAGYAFLFKIYPIPSSTPSVPRRSVARWTAPPAPSIVDLKVSALRARGVMMLKSY